MMQQYEKIKNQYADCLLFFRMGDFYELFLDDALIGVKVLNITLTSKVVSKNNRIPMAGVPYHAVEGYITKLVKAGYKVAICEQLSPPNKAGLVERDVIRIVTPGTLLSENALEKKENNYVMSVQIDSQTETFAVAFADVSTGFLGVLEKPYRNLQTELTEALSKINPSECILDPNTYENYELLSILKSQKNLNTYSFSTYSEFSDNAKSFLKKHFKVSTLASFSIDNKALCCKSTAGLLGYLQYTQKTSLSHIKKISFLSDNSFMNLDRSTMINLELFSTIREHDTRGSLLSVLDQTQTAMGGRLLKEWLIKPLVNKSQIDNRLDAIETLLKTRNNFDEVLKQIPDIERILSRISLGLGNARDLVNIKNALEQALKIKKDLNNFPTTLLKNLSKEIKSEILQLISLINKTIVDEPPIDTKIGGMIRSGISEKLDELKVVVGDSELWLAELEKQEKEKTGITSLKVRYNKVFGFYIEVSKSYTHLVPDNYLRKQTLVNGERFITSELKVKEDLILSAEEKICSEEWRIFNEVCNQVVSKTETIQKAANAIAVVDCLLGFAVLSQTNRYVRPKILHSGEIKIKNGRHPVVEKLLEIDQFVPNPVDLDNISQTLLLITGPNMAGKSVYIRQVALIVLMAQIGCFVPADLAYISLVDRIFVRSGASDVITSGLSTFMVEMVETAFILNNATENSLIVMDEIGRGTSTYDGISIAWAVAEYLATHFKKSPKTLFATHYHELQMLEQAFPKKIKNYSMAIAENEGTPVFLYTVIAGAASHSFGVAVASLAGVPEEVINTAKNKLSELEMKVHDLSSEHKMTESQITDSLEDQRIFEHLLTKELEKIDIALMRPLDALNKLAELKDKVKIIKEEMETYVQKDS